MWFNNLQLYRLPPDWNMTLPRLEETLARFAFRPAGKTEFFARGWIPPRGEGEMVCALERHWLIALGIEEKILPASVVNLATKDRVAKLEQQLGYRPGRKQAREIKENVTQDLLPRAFSRYRSTRAWLDPLHGWFVVDAANAKKAEEMLEVLRWTLDDFPAVLLRTNLSAVAAMTEWLMEGEAPPGFSIDRECELRSPVEEKALVRYQRHALNSDEVRSHLRAGKQPTRLALTWKDRISFMLTERGEVKKLDLIDIAEADAASENESAADRFDADFALMTGELSHLLTDLVEALGGEAQADGDANARTGAFAAAA
jgi:recombination associated protein RdgC